MIAKFKSLVGKVCDYALRTKLGRAATMAAVKFLVERGMLKARIELSEDISKRGPAAYKGFSDRMQMIILDILEYVEGWLPGLKEKLDEVEATVQKEGDAIEDIITIRETFNKLIKDYELIKVEYTIKHA